jgi:hypothetical protein
MHKSQNGAVTLAGTGKSHVSSGSSPATREPCETLVPLVAISCVDPHYDNTFECRHAIPPRIGQRCS